MSFFRKIFGRGDEDDRHEGADGDEGIPAGGPPTQDADDPGSHTYLEFIGGSAAKFYATVIEENADGTWTVAFNFGRIGFPRDWARKVDGVSEQAARRAFTDLVGEKVRKGYEQRAWPADLELPGGGRPDEETAPTPTASRGIYTSAVRGLLPPETGGSVADVALPPGRLLRPEQEGGPRGDTPVLWVSDAPDGKAIDHWRQLARAFPETGLWPLIVDPGRIELDRMGEFLIDEPRAIGTDPFQLLRRWWHEASGVDEGEFQEEPFRPFGRKFPGLAPRSPGDRPTSIESHVRDLAGHLGLVAVDRPAETLDAIGWMGPANYGMNPTEQSAILDTWEDRFDAYLVGVGSDTIALAVGRPPRDLPSATLVAAEHLAFCPDTIFQGTDTIEAYAPMLVGTPHWEFWWD